MCVLHTTCDPCVHVVHTYFIPGISFIMIHVYMYVNVYMWTLCTYVIIIVFINFCEDFCEEV
jgi:hypothetical protein